jgi:Mce-associated membrane protein
MPPEPKSGESSAPEPESGENSTAGPEAMEEPAEAGGGTATGRRRSWRRIRRLPVVLGVTAVLLGGLAVWFADEADGLRAGAGAHNAALTDAARTSEVKGKVTDAVNTIFSYDYTDMARTERAADGLLTGKAVQQYATMLAQVRAQAPRQKLVLTTTVTDSAVEMLDGDRARLLLFADQRNTRTTNKDTTYAAAMLAVDVVRRNGTWKITDIDTLNAPR